MIGGLAERLKHLRKSHHFSRQTVAERLGVSASVIAGYENGYRTPSVEILLKLSGIYNCSTDYLLTGSNKENVLLIDKTELSELQISAIQILIEAMKQQ